MMKRLKYGVFGIVSLLFSMSFGSAEFIGSFVCNSATVSCGIIQAPSDCVDNFSVYFDGGGQPFRVKRNGGTNADVQFYSGLVTSNCTYIEVTGSPGFVSASYPFTVNYGFNPNGGSCPEVNTGEILSGYILESEIDNLYCADHGYCPIIDTGDTENQWSALYINDIQHNGAGLINLTIPEEFERDYEYTGNGEELDIDVKGYNVDTAYIDGLITTQRTLPNNTDFNNTISGLLPLFVPGIVIIFFLYFIFRFIKKVF